MVRDSHFSSMASHSAIYLLDIDYNTTSAKQRGVSYFEDNRLRDCDGPSSLIEIAHLDNNDDDEDHYRVNVDAAIPSPSRSVAERGRWRILALYDMHCNNALTHCHSHSPFPL